MTSLLLLLIIITLIIIIIIIIIIKIIIIIIPLFTLGSICNTTVNGAEQMPYTNKFKSNLIHHLEL